MMMMIVCRLKKSENKCGRRWKKNIRKQHKINVESKIKEKQQTSE